MQTNKIYLGDCLDVCKTFTDNSIDCVVTDPPYKLIAGGVSIILKKNEVKGIFNKQAVSDGTCCSNRWLKKDELNIPSAVKAGKMFAHNEILFKDWIPQVYRVLKDGSHFYVMVNDRNMQEMLNVCSENKFKLVNILVWKKNNATPNRYYMKNMEFILLFRKGFAKPINNMGSKTCLEVPNIIGSKEHPSEKPVPLMEILIKNSSNEGDVILDPFMGSGSVGIASLQAKRSFIGIEKDETYYNLAKKRIDNTLRTGLMNLFDD